MCAHGSDDRKWISFRTGNGNGYNTCVSVCVCMCALDGWVDG